jgi:hypothetical protein
MEYLPDVMFRRKVELLKKRWKKLKVILNEWGKDKGNEEK